MAELTLDFFDKDLNFLGVIDNAEDVTFTRSWYEIGDFTIKYNINANADYAALLVEDNIVMFNKNVYKCGVISKITNQIGEKGKGDQYRIAKGYELKTIFNWRVIGQLPDVMSDGMVTWYMSDAAETCIKSLVSDQCGPTCDTPSRIFPTLQIATDQGRGSNYVINERYTSLYNVIFNCASAAQLGWYCYLDIANKKIIFDCAIGKDRTSSQSTNTWAIFSADRDTLKEASIEKSKDGDYSNYIWVGGYDGAVASYDGGTPPAGMLRHEKWIDQTSIKDTDTETMEQQLATIGAANLQKFSQTYMLDGSPLAFSQLVYMTNYDIGDTVEVNDGTNTYLVQILSAQEEWQNNNYNLTLTWGKPTPTVTRQLYETVNRAKGTALNANLAQAAATTAKMRQFATVALVNAAIGQYDGEIVYCLANCHFYQWVLSTTSWTDTSATLPNDPAAYWSADETPDIPDYAAGIIYLNDLWSSIDVVSVSATSTVSNGVLTVTPSSTVGRVQISGTFPIGTSVRVRIRRSVSSANQIKITGYNGSVDTNLYLQSMSGIDYTIVSVTTTAAYSIIRIYPDATSGTDPALIDWWYIGTAQYTTPLLDNSGNGLHSTIYGCTPVAGVSGKGIAFDGVNDYVLSNTLPSLTAFTVSFWMNYRTYEQYNDIITFLDGTVNYRLQRSASSWSMVRSSGLLPRGAVFTTTLVPDGTMAHIVLEYDGSNLRSYVNGKLNATIAGSGSVPASALRLGLSSDVILDEVILFSRALSASEVLGLYLAKSLDKRYVLADWQLDQGASDGVISNSIDKPRYREDWYKIWAADQRTTALPTTFASITTAGEYKELATDANTIGIWTPTTGGTAAKNYYDAVESLRLAYFNNGTGASDGSGFLLYSSTGDVPISSMSPTLNARLNTYRASADALSAAITTAKQNAAVATAGTNVATLAPSYVGIGILAAAATAAFTSATVNSSGVITPGGSFTPKTGDWMTNYDATNVALGIYRWTGSIWSLIANTETKYISVAGYDLLNLLTGGITIPGVTVITAAIISYLSTSMQVSNEKCRDTVTPRMQIDWDNALMSLRDYEQLSDMEVADGYVKAYKGQGVQRRYARLTQESLDWVDAPDTTPPSSEVLQGRIGRLGVGSSILMDGDFYGPITTSWGSFTTISGSYCNGGKYIKTSNGEIWVTYASLTSPVIYTKKLSGSTWGTQITVSSSAYSPILCEDNSGKLLLFYITTSNIVAYRELGGASWGSEISTGINVYGNNFLNVGLLIGDEIRIATTSTSSSYLAEYHGSGTSWTSSGVLSSATVNGADYIVSDDGYQVLIYKTPTAIYQRLLVGSSWGAETNIYTTYTSGIPVLIKEVNGYISLFCSGQKFIWQSPGWGSPVSSDLPTTAPTDIIQMNDGTLRCAQDYTDIGVDVVQESTLIKYSQIGIGIIERGSTTDGNYIKYGDGTLECWGTKQSTSNASASTRTYTITFPYSSGFIDTNYTTTFCERDTVGGVAFVPYRSKNTPTTTSVILSTINTAGTSVTGYGQIDWRTIGKWK